MALVSRGKDLGDALISWWTPSVSSLSLVSFDWHKQMEAQPGYPCNPRTQCPRAFLRLYRMDHEHPSTICNTTKILYSASVWVQLRQTVGEDHQEILVQALDTFITPIIQAKYNLTNIAPWLRNLDVLPNQGVVYDELRHPLGDPSMTVSVGEINLTLDGEIREP